MSDDLKALKEENETLRNSVNILSEQREQLQEEYKKAIREIHEKDEQIAQLKKSCFEWHDLQKNPLDVPKEISEAEIKKRLANDDGCALSDNGIHRRILLQDRHGNIYTGNYYPKDEYRTENVFAVEFLEDGFQGNTFVSFLQIKAWCEMPDFLQVLRKIKRNRTG